MTALPAALGGTPIRRGDYPSWPIWDERERERLIGTLEGGRWSQGGGHRAADFATDFAAFQGARHGLAVTNCTHALEAALVACDVGEGDEVIVPAMTFVASATAVLATNATPVIVDIDPDTLCIDVGAAEAAVTPRTRAIVAVHVAGAAADLDALLALCSARDLRLIEDCAHAHGTTWRGRGVGSWGDFGGFSMQQSKLMTAGEGGVLICNDDELRDRAWSYANTGRPRAETKHLHPTYRSNFRMTEWQGAVLSAQLERFPQQHARRNANANLLDEALGEFEGLRPQHRDPRMGSHGNYCYVFHYDAFAFEGMPLPVFEAALAAEGIPMSTSYPSHTDLALFPNEHFGPRLRTSTLGTDYADLHLPVAGAASRSTVWLQHRLLLADAGDVLDVVVAARRIQQHATAVTRAAAASMA